VDEMRTGVFLEGGGAELDPTSDDRNGLEPAFGRPLTAPGGKMIIPVARVVQVNRSSDGGGGRRVITTIPRAIIEVDEQGVRIKDITNSPALGLAGIALVAWNVFWIIKTIRTFAGKR
jgi:uncharacterized spore protein YtfJ